MKSFLSTVLCLLMLAGMLPAVFATETAPTVGAEFTYDFTTNALLDSSNASSTQNSLVTNTSKLNSEKTEPWVYAGRNNQATNNEWTATYLRFKLNPQNTARFAFKLTVPYEGKYSIAVKQPNLYGGGDGIYTNNSGKHYVAGASNLYIFPASEGLTVSNWSPETKEKVTAIKHFEELASTTEFEFETAGDYYFLFNLDMDNADFVNFYTGANLALADITRIYNTVSTITLTYMGTTGGEDSDDGSGDSGETELEDVENKFDYKEESYIGGVSSIRAFAVYGTDSETSDEQIIEAPTVTYGETCTVNAPEAPEGYTFLYWAKGATMQKKQIVSYDVELSDYLPEEGVNYLLAVYEKDDALAVDKQEFYNANGQLLSELKITNGVLPEYPSMAGYGRAKAWALRNGDGSYTEYYANEDAPETEGAGTLIFMAVYDELKNDITVTIDGVAKKYKYGDEVSCTASAPSGESFMYWTKNGEVVSLAETYSFNVWEDCEVRAVYGVGVNSLSRTMRKIILGRFSAGDSNAIMAEFIGFDDALEKGIMFGSQKIAMSSDKSQFTVLDDATNEGVATGYAIIREGNTLKKVTDGEATIGKENEEILAERRAVAESYMRESVSLLWTPSETIEYHVGAANGGFDATLVTGRIYRGLPYVYNAGTPTAFLNYAGEADANGVYTISGLDGIAMSGGQGTARVGNDCSGAIVRAWSAMGSSIQAKATKYMVPANGFIKVGDYESTSASDFTGGTIAIATANGEQKMYEAYAELQKADAMVEWDSAGGHSRMVVSVSVVRNDDGTINGSKSKIRMLEQTRTEFKNGKTYKDLYGEEYGDGTLGDVYIIGGDYNFKFSDLYAEGYLPITCRELASANYIGTPSVNDSISAPTINNLFTGTITSSWAIDTVKLEITGNGISQSATASIARANIFSFDMSQFEEDKTNGMLYGSYDVDGLSSGTYNCTVIVRLVDGTVFTVRNFDFTI